MKHLVALVLLASVCHSAEKRPNVIFVFTDDHAAHAISAYGSRINQTPNIDRLAREGMLFRNCFCTNSICAPSRAVVLTGKHSHRNGVRRNGDRFDGSQQTFPKLLRRAGYQTAVVGKWHLKSDPTGFDFWKVLIGQGSYYNPRFKSAEGVTRHKGYTTDIITDMTLDWLRNGRDPDKPFLLMYQHKAPHREWLPGPDHLRLYDDQQIAEPDTLFDDYTGKAKVALSQEMTVAHHLRLQQDLKMGWTPPGLTPPQREAWRQAYQPRDEAFLKSDLDSEELVRWKYQRYIKDYLRCVASVDDNLGRVLRYLDDTGLAQNTIVVYSSDQGFFLGDHGWYDKRWMYEESLRMPFIVRWPAEVAPGAENTDLIQNVDFAETFLDVAGADIPSDMQGRSLRPLMKGDTPDDWRSSIYYHYWEFPAVHSVARHRGVRTARFKLIHYYQADAWELFDLENDPHEMKSVYDDPRYADAQQRLVEELERLRKHTGDTGPDPFDFR